MKITQNPDVSNVPNLEDLKRFSSILFGQIASAVNGGLSLPDNFFGQAISVTFSAANTDTPLDHNLNKIVTNYIVLNRSANMVIFNGSGASTSSRIYLQSSAAGTATVYLT